MRCKAQDRITESRATLAKVKLRCLPFRSRASHSLFHPAAALPLSHALVSAPTLVHNASHVLPRWWKARLHLAGEFSLALSFRRRDPHHTLRVAAFLPCCPSFLSLPPLPIVTVALLSLHFLPALPSLLLPHFFLSLLLPRCFPAFFFPAFLLSCLLLSCLPSLLPFFPLAASSSNRY
jgi:hypothetical protein